VSCQETPRPTEIYCRTYGRVLPTGAYTSIFEHIRSSLPLFSSVETRFVLGHETSVHSFPRICLMNILRQKKALLASVFSAHNDSII